MRLGLALLAMGVVIIVMMPILALNRLTSQRV